MDGPKQPRQSRDDAVTLNHRPRIFSSALASSATAKEAAQTLPLLRVATSWKPKVVSQAPNFRRRWEAEELARLA